MEKWKDIKGYEGSYRISNYGRVKSISRIILRRNKTIHTISERILKNALVGIVGQKYHGVDLSIKNNTKTLRVHRLVAIAFIPNPERKPEVNHKDGNKLNNHIDNLEWCTSSENQIHSYKNKFQINPKGEKSYASKLSNNEADAIRMNYIRERQTITYIANAHSVSRSTIRDILNHKTYI